MSFNHRKSLPQRGIKTEQEESTSRDHSLHFLGVLSSMKNQRLHLNPNIIYIISNDLNYMQLSESKTRYLGRSSPPALGRVRLVGEGDNTFTESSSSLMIFRREQRARTIDLFWKPVYLGVKGTTTCNI